MLEVSFLVSWTPYAFVSFYTAFIDEKAISPLGATLPACIAKSAIVWSTFFFVLTNKNIRSKFQKSNPEISNQKN